MDNNAHKTCGECMRNTSPIVGSYRTVGRDSGLVEYCRDCEAEEQRVWDARIANGTYPLYETVYA